MDIFISYRRNGGIDIARNIWNELRERSYYSFFDLDSIQEGEFPEHIYQNIVRSKTFITTESGEAVTAGTSQKKEITVSKREMQYKTVPRTGVLSAFQ